jgi:hypothetical protein
MPSVWVECWRLFAEDQKELQLQKLVIRCLELSHAPEPSRPISFISAGSMTQIPLALGNSLSQFSRTQLDYDIQRSRIEVERWWRHQPLTYEIVDSFFRIAGSNVWVDLEIRMVQV